MVTTTQQPNVAEIIERFKQFYGYRFDTEVARKLGLSDGSAIGNWRRRNTADLLLIAELCPEIDFDWLMWGRGNKNPMFMQGLSAEYLKQLHHTELPKKEIFFIINEALERYLTETINLLPEE